MTFFFYEKLRATRTEGALVSTVGITICIEEAQVGTVEVALHSKDLGIGRNYKASRNGLSQESFQVNCSFT